MKSGAMLRASQGRMHWHGRHLPATKDGGRREEIAYGESWQRSSRYGGRTAQGMPSARFARRTDRSTRVAQATRMIERSRAVFRSPAS